MKLKERKQKDGTRSFYIDYRIHGVRKRETLSGIHDKKIAEVAFAEFKVRLAREQVGLPVNANLSLRKCLQSHLDGRMPVIQPSHGQLLESFAKQMIEFFGENCLVKSLTEKDVNQYRQHLRSTGNCPSTINRKTTFLQGALDKAVDEGLLRKNPVKGLEKLSDSRPEVWRYLSEEEADSVLNVLQNGDQSIRAATVTVALA